MLALGACASGARDAVVGARAHPRVQWQVDAGPRIVGTPGHAKVRDWIAAELTRLGARVELQTFPDSSLGRTLELTNVIGRWDPPAGKAPARRIALLAHYDTRPWCDQDPDPSYHDQPMPGANDAGSGVAVLLEVAEALHLRAPGVGVDLVFLDGEDLGSNEHPDEFCLGAKGYARRLTDTRPAAAFLFDMVGSKTLAIYPELNSLDRAANLVDLVWAGARATRAAHFMRAPRHRITDDHLPLLDAGLPAVDIIDFDYAPWHTHRDLPDQVSGESLAEVARVALWIVRESPLAR
jgi:hypothetical protein